MISFTMKQKLNAIGKPDLLVRVEEIVLILEQLEWMTRRCDLMIKKLGKLSKPCCSGSS